MIESCATHQGEITSAIDALRRLEPRHDRADRAMVAMADDRLEDGVMHILAMPGQHVLDRAWRHMLESVIAGINADWPKAESSGLQAAACALMESFGDEREDAPSPPGRKRSATAAKTSTAYRLAAVAYHELGSIYARQDRCDDAYCAHLAAYDLRRQHGLIVEQWETAIKLGADADLARRPADALRWYHVAVDLGKLASEEPSRLQAIAWANMAGSLTVSAQHEEAVAAARTARDFWRQHDVAAPSVAQADMRVGYALLKQAEASCEVDPAAASPPLTEAIDTLTAAHDALVAFGRAFATDAHWCLEQKDFAERLQASM